MILGSLAFATEPVPNHRKGAWLKVKNHRLIRQRRNKLARQSRKRNRSA